MYFNTIACEYLGSGSGKVLGGEASIVANDQAIFIKLVLLQVVRHPLSTNTDIIEGEIFGDDSPPTISAKLDYIIHGRLSTWLVPATNVILPVSCNFSKDDFLQVNTPL